MTDLIKLDNQPLSITQAQNDAQLIYLWLHSEGRRSERTRDEYARDIRNFQDHNGLLLREVCLDHILNYQSTSLSDLSISTQARRLASLKSLFAFAHKVGYLAFDVGKVVSTPPIEDKLSERILSEEELFRILSLETNKRNLLLLKLFYVSAGRVSEVCALQWRNLQSRESGGQITFFGKGGKTRTVLIPENLWTELLTLRTQPSFSNSPKSKTIEQKPSAKHQYDEDRKLDYSHQSPCDIESNPVFLSQKHSALSKSQAWRIVRAAAVRAGITRNVSPHWFRHAHISHALDNRAPIHLVSESAGHANLSTTSRYTHCRPGESSSSYLKIK